MILSLNSDYLLERPLLFSWIYVMAKCGVLFEVGNDFLSITKTSALASNG
jgi:hypothetical protein